MTRSARRRLLEISEKGGVPAYPYHNKIKQRIRGGELVAYDYVTDYPRIGEALVLYFSTYPPVRPIRPRRYAEYAPLLAAWEAQREDGAL